MGKPAHRDDLSNESLSTGFYPLTISGNGLRFRYENEDQKFCGRIDGGGSCRDDWTRRTSVGPIYFNLPNRFGHDEYGP